MTQAYHGSKDVDFEPNEFIKSRYGFPVLFFTDNKILSSYYATPKGKIFKTELRTNKKIDFGGEFSYSLKFRNLVHLLHHQQYDVVEITNVYDRPNDNFPLEKSTIYVVFNFSKIQNLTKCTQ